MDLGARHGNISLELSFDDLGHGKSTATSQTSWYGHVDEGGHFNGLSSFTAQDFGDNFIHTYIEMWSPSLISDEYVLGVSAESAGTVLTKDGDVSVSISVDQEASGLGLTISSTNAGASATAKTSWVKDEIYKEPRWTFQTSSNYTAQSFGANDLGIDVSVASSNFIPGYYDESGSWGFDMKSFVQSDGSLLPVECFTDRARVSVHVNGISDFSDNEVLEVALALIDENSESKPTHVYVIGDLMYFEAEKNMFLNMKIDYDLAEIFKGSLSQKMSGGLPTRGNQLVLPAYYFSSETSASGESIGDFYNSFNFRAGARVDLNEGRGDLIFVLTDNLVSSEMSDDWRMLISSEIQWILMGEGMREIYSKMIYEPPYTILASSGPSAFLCDITIAPPSLISTAAEVDATLHLDGIFGLGSIYERSKLTIGQKISTNSGEILFR